MRGISNDNTKETLNQINHCRKWLMQQTLIWVNQYFGSIKSKQFIDEDSMSSPHTLYSNSLVEEMVQIAKIMLWKCLDLQEAFLVYRSTFLTSTKLSPTQQKIKEGSYKNELLDSDKRNFLLSEHWSTVPITWKHLN